MDRAQTFRFDFIYSVFTLNDAKTGNMINLDSHEN